MDRRSNKTKRACGQTSATSQPAWPRAAYPRSESISTSTWTAPVEVQGVLQSRFAPTAQSYSRDSSTSSRRNTRTTTPRVPRYVRFRPFRGKMPNLSDRLLRMDRHAVVSACSQLASHARLLALKYVGVSPTRPTGVGRSAAFFPVSAFARHGFGETSDAARVPIHVEKSASLVRGR